MAKILIVDDEQKIRHILGIMLRLKGHTIHEADTGRAALRLLEEDIFDVVISDILMPEMDGMELLKRIQGMEVPVPVIVITAFGTIESAVDAMKEGAVDYITKPFEEDKIILAVEKAVGVSNILKENIRLKRKLRKLTKTGEIVCVSKAMQRVIDMASRVARAMSRAWVSPLSCQ